MSVEMSKGKRILFLIALMMTTFVTMGDNLLYPITSNIYGEFYENISLTNYVVSGPLLLIFVFSLIAPMMLKKMSKKTMLVLGCVIFSVSAMFGASVASIEYMAVMRTITGIGQAFVSVAAMALIAEIYTDEQQCGAMMGNYNSFLPVAGIVFGLLSGMLAVGNWRNAYWAYLITIPMTILVVLFIPNLKQTESAGEVRPEAKSGKKEAFPVFFWIAIVTFLLVVIAFNMMAFYASFYVVEHNLGNESVAGIMSTMISVGSMVFCMAYGKIYSKAKVHTMTVAIVCLMVALALLRFVPNVLLSAVALVLVGGAYGVAQTYCYAVGAEYAPEGRADTAIGIVTATYAIGGFVSTYISTWLMEVMNTNGMITPTLIVPLAMTVVCLIAFPVFAKKAN